MKYFVELLGTVLLGVLWLVGMVLAKGFWSTTFAVCVPPYAWYLVVERGMAMARLIGV